MGELLKHPTVKPVPKNVEDPSPLPPDFKSAASGAVPRLYARLGHDVAGAHVAHAPPEEPPQTAEDPNPLPPDFTSAASRAVPLQRDARYRVNSEGPKGLEKDSL